MPETEHPHTQKIGPLPKHVAIIMDGNGRWAQQRGLPRAMGHRAGTENIRRIIETFHEHGVDCLTLFAFSTENWDRPREEVLGLMRLLGRVIKRETKELHRRGVRIRHLGRMDGLSKRLQDQIQTALDLTKDNTEMTVNVCLDYGGRTEIVDAVRRIAAEGIPPEEINEQTISRHLYTADLPDPDLIIRTAGEMRLSNFLLWQGAYAEYYSTPVLWPDFDQTTIERALLDYSQRQRRFGGLSGEKQAPGQARFRLRRR
jgi:undecaprenyl diphosphate synthase